MSRRRFSDEKSESEEKRTCNTCVSKRTFDHVDHDVSRFSLAGRRICKEREIYREIILIELRGGERSRERERASNEKGKVDTRTKPVVGIVLRMY